MDYFLEERAQEKVNPTHQTEKWVLSLPRTTLVLAEEGKDQNMVDLTENEASADIEEPNEPFTQEENEEHFIETLIERNQNGESKMSFKPFLILGGKL